LGADCCLRGSAALVLLHVSHTLLLLLRLCGDEATSTAHLAQGQVMMKSEDIVARSDAAAEVRA
jgi:hypothetical protein